MSMKLYFMLIAWSMIVWALSAFGCCRNSRVIIGCAAVFWAAGCVFAVGGLWWMP